MRSLTTFEAESYGKADIWTPAEGELHDALAAMQSKNGVVIPSGNGSQAYLGRVDRSVKAVVSTCNLQAVVAYEPDDYTISVQAGLPVAELRRILAENGQDMPVDAATGGTVGGLINAGFGGPRSARYGGLRNTVIGARAVRCGDPPSAMKTGGRVVKNVAGYDLAKLLIGSLGSLAVLTEVNFKLRPLPPARRAYASSFETIDDAWLFAGAVRGARLGPASLHVLDGAAATTLELGLNSSAAHVLWSFEGSAAAILWQSQQVESLLVKAGTSAPRQLEEKERAAVIESLCTFARPSATSSSLAIVRATTVPNAAAALARSLSEGKPSAIACDVEGGGILVHWQGSAEELAIQLDHAGAVIREHDAQGVVVYAPTSLRRSRPYLLHLDGTALIMRKIAAVFDPSGHLANERVLGAPESTATRDTSTDSSEPPPAVAEDGEDATTDSATVSESNTKNSQRTSGDA